MELEALNREIEDWTIEIEDWTGEIGNFFFPPAIKDGKLENPLSLEVFEWWICHCYV